MYKVITIVSLALSLVALGYAKYTHDHYETDRIIKELTLGER